MPDAIRKPISATTSPDIPLEVLESFTQEYAQKLQTIFEEFQQGIKSIEEVWDDAETTQSLVTTLEEKATQEHTTSQIATEATETLKTIVPILFGLYTE